MQNTSWLASPTPVTDGLMHKHLRRLERVWIDWPIYFITTCTLKRRAVLASQEAAEILIDEWRKAHDRHGWAIGRYVVMPDHVHFFCSAEFDAKTLPTFIQAWKQWTSKRIARESSTYLELSGRKSSLIMFCAQAKATARNGTMLKRIRCGLIWLKGRMSGHGRARFS